MTLVTPKNHRNLTEVPLSKEGKDAIDSFTPALFFTKKVFVIIGIILLGILTVLMIHGF